MDVLLRVSQFDPRWRALHLKQVVYWEDDTKPETMGKVRVPWNQTSVTVSGLAGNTQYFLTVSAFNTAGTGPFLPAINVTTKKPRKYEHQHTLLLLLLLLPHWFQFYERFESQLLLDDWKKNWGIYASSTHRDPMEYLLLIIFLEVVLCHRRNVWCLWWQIEMHCFYLSCSTSSASTQHWMDSNWLSAVSLLGTCGGYGIRVWSDGLPSEFFPLHIYTYIFTLCHPPCFSSLHLAVIQEAETQRGKHAHDIQLYSRADPPRGRRRLHHPHSDSEWRRARPGLGPHTNPPIK